MQITLEQDNIEAAIKQYVKEVVGIQQPITEITFNTARKGGFSIGADLTIDFSKPVSFKDSYNKTYYRQTCAPESTAHSHDPLPVSEEKVATVEEPVKEEVQKTSNVFVETGEPEKPAEKSLINLFK